MEQNETHLTEHTHTHSYGIFILVWLSLMILTAITVAVAGIKFRGIYSCHCLSNSEH